MRKRVAMKTAASQDIKFIRWSIQYLVSTSSIIFVIASVDGSTLTSLLTQSNRDQKDWFIHGPHSKGRPRVRRSK